MRKYTIFPVLVQNNKSISNSHRERIIITYETTYYVASYSNYYFVTRK